MGQDLGRIYEVGPLVCPIYKVSMHMIAFIEDDKAIKKIF